MNDYNDIALEFYPTDDLPNFLGKSIYVNQIEFTHSPDGLTIESAITKDGTLSFAALDGKVLKVPIPPLDEERRKDMAKHIKAMMEDEKTALRNMRREAKEMIEILEKEKEATEDDKYWGYDKLQEITDINMKKVEELASAKEKEILEL